MSDVSRLIEFAFAGRAVLFAGQNLDTGATEQLQRELASKLDLPASTTLADLCTKISDPGPMLAAIRAMSEKGSEAGLRRIAGVPWAAVFSSAFDDVLSTELAGQDSQGRRLRHLCLNDEMPAFFPRRNDVLTVLHLSHLADNQTTTGLPIYGSNWGRAQRLLIPGVLRTLPQAIGPAHLLCIAGIGVNDPIDASLVTDIANELDPDNVYWFLSAADGLSLDALRKLAPNIHFVVGDLATAIESHVRTTANQQSLSALKEQVLELNDLAVTVKSGETQRALTFRASELREFRRHLVIVPDLIAKVPSRDTSKRKQDFIRFLSFGRQTPDWDGISEGFAFQRDSYVKLLEAVRERVGLIVGSTPRPQIARRGGENAPIFLAGPPASGRTIGLLWLAYHLKRDGIFVVHLLPSGGLVDNGAVEQILRLAQGTRGPCNDSSARSCRPTSRRKPRPPAEKRRTTVGGGGFGRTSDGSTRRGK